MTLKSSGKSKKSEVKDRPLLLWFSFFIQPYFNAQILFAIEENLRSIQDSVADKSHPRAQPSLEFKASTVQKND